MFPVSMAALRCTRPRSRDMSMSWSCCCRRVPTQRGRVTLEISSPSPVGATIPLFEGLPPHEERGEPDTSANGGAAPRHGTPVTLGKKDDAACLHHRWLEFAA